MESCTSLETAPLQRVLGCSKRQRLPNAVTAKLKRSTPTWHKTIVAYGCSNLGNPFGNSSTHLFLTASYGL